MSNICSEVSAVVGCHSTPAGVQTSVVIHYEYRVAASGARTLHSIHYTNAAGVNVSMAGGDVVTPGQCIAATVLPDVDFLVMCDTQSNGAIIEFVRRTITTFTAGGTPTTVVANLTADFSTPYASTGTVGLCDAGCDAVAPVGLVTTWS